MMIITLAGKILGLLRDRLLTVNYGSGMATNAFLTASRIPRVFFDAVFASAIAASFIPIFSEYITKKSKDEAFKFSGNFLTIITAISFLLTVVGMVFSKQFAMFFADGYDADTMALCIKLTRIMFPTILFTGIAYSFVGILQSLDEFNVPASISLISNAIIIVYYYTFNKDFGIFGLAVTFLIAWFAQAAVQVPSLKKKGFRLHLSLNFRSEGIKKVFSLMLPVMVSSWVLPINQTINSKFGSRLFDGAGVSAIELSYNLYTVIAGVFVLSVTNYIFPKLSRITASNDKKSFQETLSATMHSSMYFVVPMMLGLMVLSTPIIDLIYGGGEFDAFSVNITSRSMFYMSLGMVGYAAQAILCRAYFAEQKGRVPLIAGIISIGVNVLLCMALIEKFDVAGLALASAISCTINAAILAIPLQRRGQGFISAKFLLDMAKIVIAALIMAVGTHFVYTAMAGSFSGTVGKFAVIIIPAVVGVAIYFAATILLRLPEGKMTVSFVKKLIKR